MNSKHWFVFILLGAIWSSSFMWIKLALREIDPVTLVAFRVLLGFLFGAGVILIKRDKLPRDLRKLLPLIILGLTNFAAPFFLISWGEKSIDSSVASILDATVPLFTILLAHFSLKDDKITVSKVLGLLIGFGGVVILLSKDISSSNNTLIGEAAVVAASIFYAGSSVFIRKTTQDIPASLRSTGPLLSATVIMLCVSWLSGDQIPLPALKLTWIALLFLGIIGSGLAFIMAFYLIHEIGPTRSTMVTYIFPLGGVLLGVTFLHEQVTWQLIAGGILIISSLVIANYQPSEKISFGKIEIERD